MSDLKTSATNDARWLQRASVLGKAWFPKQRQGINFGFQPVFLSPSVRIVHLRIGDVVWSYAHGQELEQKITWVPEAGTQRVEWISSESVER